ncbi:hypothetical protein BKA66DRAFT_574367 [Pyrenochaeta sp. MPI-SDFR-AT-0127]|nr:hypothetical protein BKA66DRAFT_574367 [Pyrenochaeta sp. MPI-SDFR-AT-0127]
MGNCGSSLDCNKCYSKKAIKGCLTEIDVNPDIAGIGVLIAFYTNAIAITVVLLWGYVTQSLPPYVYQTTDLYTLRLVKRYKPICIDSKVDSKPTKGQQKKAMIVTHFVKVLNNQPLITGLAILVAAFGSRCRISIYEFNIVVYLTFFAIYTHALSLSMLRRYFYQHTFAQICQITFTIAFLIFFGFSFYFNTASESFEDTISQKTLNVGNSLQCIFNATRLRKPINFNILDTIIVVGLVIYSHAFLLGDLYLEPAKTYMEPPNDTATVIIYYCIVLTLRTSSLPRSEYSEVVLNSERKYWAWLQPPSADPHETHISFWYLVETYFVSYLSDIPSIFLGISYGTGSIIQAIWYGGLEPSNGLSIMGFGQIVAIGLLALMLLAASEILNEEEVQHSSSVLQGEEEEEEEEDNAWTEQAQWSKEPEQMAKEQKRASNKQNQAPEHDINAFSLSMFDRLLDSLARLGMHKSRAELEKVKAGNFEDYDDDAQTARSIAVSSFVLFIIHALLSLFCGVGWIFPQTNDHVSHIALAYLVARFLLFLKRILVLIYFIRDEIRRRARKQKHSLQSSSAQRDSIVDASATALDQSGNPPSSSVGSLGLQQRPTTVEGLTHFDPPRRQDTEADIGLVPLARRRTNLHANG